MAPDSPRATPDWRRPVTDDPVVLEAGIQSARQLVVVLFVLAGLFLFTAQPALTVLNLGLGTALLFLTMWPWVVWFKSPQRHLPYFETLTLHFFAVYVPPIFLAPVTFQGVSFVRNVSDEELTQTLWLLVGSMIVFHLAYRTGRRWFPGRLPPFDLDRRLTAPVVLVYLALAAFGPLLLPAFPPGLGKVAHLLFQVNAGVAVYLLSALWHAARLKPVEVFLFHGLLAAFLILALATGWLTFAVFPVYAYFLAEIQLKKAIPWSKILAAFVLLIAFNATKDEFRKIYWGERMGGEPVDSFEEGYGRARDWVDITLEEDLDLVEAQRETLLARLNNLAFLAHVVESTPEEKAHLRWKTYAVVPAMFVPRLVWPEKPSVMEVANDIALRYGALGEWQIGKVALDVGLIPEGYIAFGALGALGAMVLLGLFTAWITNWLGDPVRGLGWAAPLVGILCGGGIMVTWAAQNFLGGLWQAAFVVFLLYFPLRQRSCDPSGRSPW